MSGPELDSLYAQLRANTAGPGGHATEGSGGSKRKGSRRQPSDLESSGGDNGRPPTKKRRKKSKHVVEEPLGEDGRLVEHVVVPRGTRPSKSKAARQRSAEI